MRHGHYQDNGSLTKRGIQKVRKAAKIFKDQPIVIYSSPVTRCRETALLIKEEIVQSELHEIPWLSIDVTTLPENCLSYLKGAIIVVVSHQPILCKLAGKLILSNGRFIGFDCGIPVKFHSIHTVPEIGALGLPETDVIMELSI